MATVPVDAKIKAVVDAHGWMKVAMSVLFVGLSYLKGKGVFSKKAGPQ